ncbi:MAG: NPCBM/NEW2 domain-containing protein, partial [Lachnospiraceae bacterium]|nr:NPCBM/NEW2 domain-containing protein [Lachnospiraceae bacterium]
QTVAYYLAAEGVYDEYWIGGSRVSVSTTGNILTADEEESVILGEEETLIVSEEDTYGDEWEWVNGEAFDYTNWRDGEPNNSNDAEYLATIRDDGKWNDRPEDYLTGFIMEVEAESGLTEAGNAALTSLEWSDSKNMDVWTSALDSQGDLHFNAIAMNASGDAWLLCDLNGEYASMTGTLSVYDGAEDGVSLEIGIFGDGELLYELSDFTKNMEAETFTVDLTGVKTLIIVTGNEGKSGDAYLLMSETKLTAAEEGSTGELVQRLGDQTVVDSSGGLDGSSVGLFVDAWGEFHSSYISMNAAADTYILYNLNSGLSTLTGTLTAFADTSRDMTATVTFYDYSSGESLGRYMLSKDGGSVPIEIDISGVSTLRIVVETQNEVNNAWIALTDDRLLP